MTDYRERWRETIYAEVRKKPNRLFLSQDRVVPMGSIWSGSREWKNLLRESGLRAGDRILIEASPETTFLNVLLCSLWDGYTLCPVHPNCDLDAEINAVDPRLVLSPRIQDWNEQGGVSGISLNLRETHFETCPDARFILQTSGTTGHAKRVVVSDAGIWANLDAHRPLFSMEGKRVASLLPWHHSFGLILDLLPALIDAAEIVRIPEFGRDVDGLIELCVANQVQHLSCVPLTIEKMADCSGGARLIRSLEGGVIGGAPVSGPVCDLLKQSRLRVGYGQTEASPGILLGEPGAWESQYIGKTLGCEVRVAEDGELEFKGANQCIGLWDAQHGLEPYEAGRWNPTGDVVEQTARGFVFRGRKRDWFKLNNGRGVAAGIFESHIKQALTDLKECFLTSVDSASLILFHSGEVPEDTLKQQCSTTLEALATRLVALVPVSPEDWVFTKKGALDRAVCHQLLTQKYALCQSPSRATP